jgi:hypothetical protein
VLRYKTARQQEIVAKAAETRLLRKVESSEGKFVPTANPARKRTNTAKAGSYPLRGAVAQVLARHVIRHPQVNELAVKLRKAQALDFPDWEKGKRVPQASSRTWRP